jgi:hypothetical protein
VTPKQEILNGADDLIVSAIPLTRSKRSEISDHTIIPPLLPQLDKAKYEKIKLWGPEEYQGYRKGGKRGGENPLTDKSNSSILSIFMEDENGNQIPEKTKKVVRKTAKAFYEGLLKNGNAPTAWGHATLSIRHTFINMLETEFPFLRFCEGHWKANQVATNSYSQWYLKALERKAAALAKKANKRTTEEHGIIDVDVDENDLENPSKRPGDNEDNVPGPSKRPRVENPRPTSTIPRPRPTRITPTAKKVRESFDLIICVTKSIQRIFCTNLWLYAQEVRADSICSANVRPTPSVPMIPATEVCSSRVL